MATSPDTHVVETRFLEGREASTETNTNGAADPEGMAATGPEMPMPLRNCYVETAAAYPLLLSPAEERERAGLLRQPMTAEEVEIWEAEQDWGDE